MCCCGRASSIRSCLIRRNRCGLTHSPVLCHDLLLDHLPECPGREPFVGFCTTVFLFCCFLEMRCIVTYDERSWPDVIHVSRLKEKKQRNSREQCVDFWEQYIIFHVVESSETFCKRLFIFNIEQLESIIPS